MRPADSRENGGRFASQSAMEYLMTYGWAILIIAVILGVLFSLGVFNPVNYAPRVPAGNCHVFRPNGPGTNFNADLVGTCSGFLPQYAVQFNGQSNEYIATPALPQLPQVTVVGWFYVQPSSSSWGSVSAHTSGSGEGLLWEGSTATSFSAFFDINGTGHSGITLPTSQWVMIAYTMNSSNVTGYGFAPSSSPSEWETTPANSTVPSTEWYLGTWGTGKPFNGLVANIQIYNTSLDANEVQYLYNEGIGGAPIYLSHLIGWWPMNGDVKDYSGNDYHATSTGISFNGSWTTGYSQP